MLFYFFPVSPKGHYGTRTVTALMRKYQEAIKMNEGNDSGVKFDTEEPKKKTFRKSRVPQLQGIIYIYISINFFLYYKK